MTHFIPARNFEFIKKKIDGLQKRAAKMKVAPLQLVVRGENEVEEYDDHLKTNIVRIYYECELVGQFPKFEGWELVAVIEPIKDTKEVLIREIPGQICPELYRKTDMRCDYCESNRKRNVLYVVKNNNEYKQIGKNCVSKFLGGTDPEFLFDYANYICKLTDLFAHASNNSWQNEEHVLDIYHFVTIVATVMRKRGWVPKSQADEKNPATAQIAFRLCAYPNNWYIDEKADFVVTEEDIRTAKEALQWARELDPSKAKNNYIYDLGVACRSNVVVPKTAGYVASVISAYNNHLLFEVKFVKPRTSVHLGSIGERITVNKVRVIRCDHYNNTDYDTTYLSFLDEKENLLVWKTSTKIELHVNSIVNIKGTVDKHEEVGGVKRTRLKRVVVNDPETTNM